MRKIIENYNFLQFCQINLRKMNEFILRKLTIRNILFLNFDVLVTIKNV